MVLEEGDDGVLLESNEWRDALAHVDTKLIHTFLLSLTFPLSEPNT